LPGLINNIDIAIFAEEVAPGQGGQIAADNSFLKIFKILITCVYPPANAIITNLFCWVTFLLSKLSKAFYSERQWRAGLRPKRKSL